MGWFSNKKEEENPTYDFFAEQAKLLGIDYKSTVPQGIELFVEAFKKHGSDPKFTQTGLQYSYDILPKVMGFPNQAAVNLMADTRKGVEVTDVIASDIIGKLKNPEFQAKNIGAMLSQGENLGAQGNKTGVYGGVPQLIGMIDKMDWGSGVGATQELGGFLNSFAGLLGLDGGDIENVKQAVDKIDDKEIPWT